MNARLWPGLILVAALSACSNFQPSPAERGLAFPLQPCSQQKLQAAERQLTIDQSLEFSDDWVCVTPMAEKRDPDRAVPPQGLASAEELRTMLEAPFTGFTGEQRAEFGIALAGGGSKASAFAVGVMAGLADNQLLDSADYISSVSGGSYAAYFYYTHRIFPGQRTGPRPQVASRDLYRDCVRIPPDGAVTKSLSEKISAFGGCNRWHLTPSGWSSTDAPPFNQHQAFLRCQQDVLRPGVCSTQTTVHDAGMSGWAVLGTVTLFPFSNIANSLFDWGYGVSISQRTYRRGIGLAYGSTLTDPAGLMPAEGGKRINVVCAPQPGAMAQDCDSQGFFSTPDGHALSFQELRAGLLQSRRSGKPLPFWIINAAAPRYRSLFGWLNFDIKDPENRDMFEMSAVSHGSPRFGYVSAPVSLHGMNVLDAVAASAAFFDSNQLQFGQPARGVLGVGQHLLNLDWGADIPNYNVSDGRRAFHKTMPFPLYYLDSLYSKLQSGTLNGEDRTRSVFIRLIDGGNAENLGAYALLKRQVKTVLISDAAQDTEGEFQDICGLARRLTREPSATGGSGNWPAESRYLYIPGLADFEAHCRQRQDGKPSYYNLRAWTLDFPVLIACLRIQPAQRQDQPCKDLGPQDTRLLIVKPAIDLERFARTQVQPNPLASPDKQRVLTTCQLPGTGPASEPRPLNCDSSVFLLDNWSPKTPRCPVFPQHSTAGMTMDSSYNLFAAYRELARQYVQDAAGLIGQLTSAAHAAQGIARFERIAEAQEVHPLRPTQWKCGGLDGRQTAAAGPA
jgi:hypothetical protein